MKTRIQHGSNAWNFEGETIQELIENNFYKLDDVIQKKAGNIAGYVLDTVYASFDEEQGCAKLCVFAHGSDDLSGYDPTKDSIKEVDFQLLDFGAKDLPEPYHFAIMPNRYDPFSAATRHSTAEKVGVLEAAIDYLADTMNSKRPAETLVSQMETLRRNSFQAYLARLMTLFGFLRYRKTGKNEKFEALIQDLVVALQDVTQLTFQESGSSTIYYYKAKGCFMEMDKTTALCSFRKRLGKTQTEVADELGISLRQYQRYESTNSSLGYASKEMQKKVADAVGVSVKEIIEGEQIILK